MDDASKEAVENLIVFHGLEDGLGDVADTLRMFCAELDAIKAEVEQLRRALEPFSNAAGEFFAQNGEKGDLIYEGGEMRSDCIFGEDLFTARQALKGQAND